MYSLTRKIVMCASYKFVLRSLKNLSTVFACFILFYDDIYFSFYLVLFYILLYTLTSSLQRILLIILKYSECF